MIINVEFFDENPIENVITNLNYKVDKTIFFGYADGIKEYKACTERFLKKYCGVHDLEFYEVDAFDLRGLIRTIKKVVKGYLAEGHKVFFDLTGGESMMLAAFGMLSKELKAPIHAYDICSGRMHEYGYKNIPLLSEETEHRPISLNLDQYISLYGGIINYRMHKDFKEDWNDKAAKDVEEMWNLSRRYKDKWAHYSALIRKFVPDDSLAVRIEEKRIRAEMKKNSAIGSREEFQSFLDDCENAGFLKDVCHENGIYGYQYKNETIKNYFWDSGSILEMYTFLKETGENNAKDCRVGVHIDWDGVLHNSPGRDVLNEIDILSIKDNIPIFISCKMGNVNQMALYELETVANRFGGKYAKKVLVVAKDISRGHLLRAREMGIEVRKL